MNYWVFLVKTRSKTHPDVERCSQCFPWSSTERPAVVAIFASTCEQGFLLSNLRRSTGNSELVIGHFCCSKVWRRVADVSMWWSRVVVGPCSNPRHTTIYSCQNTTYYVIYPNVVSVILFNHVVFSSFPISKHCSTERLFG